MEPERELKLFGLPIPVWVQNAYKFIGILLFGAACSQLTTDIGKYTIGRLRPHFLSVCQPILPDGTNCTNPANFHKYIIDFTCGNENASKRKLKEMRLSFPSGHSSFSMYTMVFAALYIHCRMELKGSKLFKHFLQFAFISMAWYTALSRVSDYKHHCESFVMKMSCHGYSHQSQCSWNFSPSSFLGSDVLAGSLQGLVVCLLIVFAVSDLFKNRWRSSEEKPAGSRYELNSQNSRSN
jgi:phosphatidate phosphatase